MKILKCNLSNHAKFWENNFLTNHAIWGFQPAPSALITKDLFVEQHLKSILIPGIGYGRNAQVFRDNGISVTGIEISKTAIEIAHQHYGTEMKIYHGSVTDMPFDSKMYDGIFCYALIHLLDSKERVKLITDCYHQLAENGLMVFAVATTKASLYGKGKLISKNRFEISEGLNLFFYDKDSITEEFAEAGLFEILEVEDVYSFYLIKCRKENQ